MRKNDIEICQQLEHTKFKWCPSDHVPTERNEANKTLFTDANRREHASLEQSIYATVKHTMVCKSVTY